MSNFTDADFTAMQQQLQANQQLLQQLLQQQQQQQQQQQSVSTSNDMDNEDIQLEQLHSFETRPQYDWVPLAELQQFLELESNLFKGFTLLDEQRKRIIEQYPPIQGLNYQPPSTIPDAYNRMGQDQKREDKMLKHHQYVLSAAFRPLDLLAHEISLEANNPNTQRYLYMISDIRKLILHATNALTQSRKNIAFKSVNSEFRAIDVDPQDYIMEPSEFQASISQQHVAQKALNNAQKYNTKKPSSSFHGRPPSFFRQGPPSQHGGFQRSTYSNTKSQPSIYPKQRQQNHNANVKSKNPFRQQNDSQ